MDWRNVDTSNCSVGRTLDLIGDRWTLLLVRELLNDVRRFSDLRVHLDISAPVLSRRLKALGLAGLVVAVPYKEDGSRPRMEYELTETGRELQVVVLALMQFGDQHLADPKGPAVVLVDAASQQRVRLALVRPDGSVMPPDSLRWRKGAAFRELPH